MKNSLYIIAIVLVIAWGIGFFGTNVGSVIHILLVIALFAVILRDKQTQESLKKLIAKLR
jgi:Flp pilus assembly protein TadB